MFDLGHQSSFVSRHSIAFTICLRDRPCELLCGDGLFMLLFALRCMLSKFQVLYGHQSFASTLASDNPPCWRKDRTRFTRIIVLQTF
jgi:hypothetical protein